jgi:beta-lactam-binding protein with PASTA domain
MSYLRSALGVGGAAAALAALAISGSGVAAASTDVTGQKYSDAQTALSSAGLKPVVVSTVGDEKAWPDCVVTRTQKRTVQPPENSSGSATNEMLVSLNCDAGIASATSSGNSAASPEGRAAAAAAAQQASGGSS